MRRQGKIERRLLFLDVANGRRTVTGQARKMRRSNLRDPTRFFHGFMETPISASSAALRFTSAHGVTGKRKK
jgi:hypothetical protein